MRLIGNVKNEKQAFLFYSFLLGEGIHCTYEIDKAEQKNVVLIWVYEEDQIERAEAYLEEFKANPNDPKFTKVEFPEAPPVPPDHIAEPKKPEAPQNPSWKDHPRKIKKHPITSLVLLVCIFLYMVTVTQEVQMMQADGELAIELGMTPIQQELMFDYPASNQKIDQLLQQYPLKDYKTFDEIPPQRRKLSKRRRISQPGKGSCPASSTNSKKSPRPPPSMDRCLVKSEKESIGDSLPPFCSTAASSTSSST